MGTSNTQEGTPQGAGNLPAMIKGDRVNPKLLKNALRTYGPIDNIPAKKVIF